MVNPRHVKSKIAILLIAGCTSKKTNYRKYHSIRYRIIQSFKRRPERMEFLLTELVSTLDAIEKEAEEVIKDGR